MKLTVMTFLAALLLSFSAPARAADAAGATGKGTYLVTAPHSAESCLKAMDEVAKNKKLLTKARWGCMAGDHTAYLETEANSPEDAINQLPESARATAKAVKVVKLTPEQIKKFHEAEMKQSGKGMK